MPLEGTWSIIPLTGVLDSTKQYALETFRIEGEITQVTKPTYVTIEEEVPGLFGWFPYWVKFTDVSVDEDGKFSVEIKKGIGSYFTLPKAELYKFRCGSYELMLEMKENRYLEWIPRCSYFKLTKAPETKLMKTTCYAYSLLDALTEETLKKAHTYKRLWRGDTPEDCQESWTEERPESLSIYHRWFDPSVPKWVYGIQWLKWIWNGDDYYAPTQELRWIEDEEEKAVQALEIRVGTPTLLTISGITEEEQYWGKQVGFTAELIDKEKGGIVNKSFHISIKYGETLYWEDDWTGSGSKGWTIPSTWAGKKCTIEASFIGSPGIAPHYIASEDWKEFNVVKKPIKLTITTPTTYIPPGETEEREVDGPIWEVPLGSKATYGYTLKDATDDSPLISKTIAVKFKKEEAEVTDTLVTGEEGDVSKQWVFTSGNGFSTGYWIHTASYAGDTGYQAGEAETPSSLGIGKEPPRLEYKWKIGAGEWQTGDCTIKVGEEGTFEWTLKRSITTDPITGADIMVTWRGGEHTSFGTKTTDGNGKVTYPWTPTDEEVGETMLQASYDGDTYAARIDEGRKVEVLKIETSISLTGPTILVLEGKSSYEGILTEVPSSAGVEGASIEIYKDKQDWVDEEEPWKTETTDNTGKYIFYWTPEVIDLGTHILYVRFEEDDIHLACDTELTIGIEKKTGTISYKLSDDQPVPEASMWINGWLLDEQFACKGGETIELYKDDVLFDSTTTSSELGKKGYFEFSFDAPTEVKAYTFSLRWAGDAEWKAIQHDFQITVAKESPVVYLSIPHTSVEDTDFRLSACLISYHGAEVGSQTLEVYDIDAESIVDSGVTDTDGFLKLLQSLSKGDYNWRIDYDGSYQLEAKSSTPVAFYLIEEPDYTRPKFLVRLYDSAGTEKDISPLEDIISLTLSRSTVPEADTFSTGLNNKDSKYSEGVARGDRVGIYLAYEPTNWSKVPLAIRGIVEETGRGLSTKGEILTLKGQDYTLLLKNRWITDAKYKGETPHYILTDTVESIFKKTDLDTEFDFDIVAPNGWPNKTNFSFDKKSILDCLKEIRDRSTELMGREYEFFVVSKEVKPLLVFRPKLASPISCEVLEVGKDVINAELKDVISSIKNRVQITGAKKPFQESKSFPNIGANQTIFDLEHSDVRVLYLGVDDQKKEEGVEKDFRVDSFSGMVIFEQPPPEGSTIDVTFEYLEEIVCEGDDGSHWWINQESIDNNEQRDFILPTSIENIEELDKLAKAILLAYKDPILAIKLKTKGLFMAEAGYDVKFKYSTEGLDDFYKIVNLDQSFTKGGGFVSTVNLIERLPDIGEIIAGVIGGSY